MKTKLFSIFVILLILPLISANVYGANEYGCGLFGIGCSDEATSPTGGGGGGGGGGSKIQFDVKILEIDSNLTPGDYFDFSYFVKGVGSINHDVIIDFWIEDLDGGIVSSGSDVIYFGVNEEKTETASLLIPNGIKSGIYILKVKATYTSITGESHRTIQIDVERGLVEQLFDISFFLEETLLKSSDELTAVVTLESFGTQTTDIRLSFIILDEEGNELHTEQQVVSVETERVLRKKFVGLNLRRGEYTIVLETLYNVDVFDEFSQDFEIRRSLFPLLYYIIGFILFLILFLIFKRRKKKKKKVKKKRRAKKRKKKSTTKRKSIHKKIEKEVGKL